MALHELQRNMKVRFKAMAGHPQPDIAAAIGINEYLLWPMTTRKFVDIKGAYPDVMDAPKAAAHAVARTRSVGQRNKC